jgi:hypothetical protein
MVEHAFDLGPSVSTEAIEFVTERLESNAA